VRVAPSSIHGTGLFANSDLDIGTVATFFPVHSLRCANLIMQDTKEWGVKHILHRSHSVDCFQHSDQGSCLQHLTMVADPNRKTPGWLGSIFSKVRSTVFLHVKLYRNSCFENFCRHFANDAAVPVSDSEADISEYAAACRNKANCILVDILKSQLTAKLNI